MLTRTLQTAGFPARSARVCDCEELGWWLPYAEPASADPGCACGLADRGAPGHQEEPTPSALDVPAVEFGEDVHRHKCGEWFVLHVSTSLAGTAFSVDGYAYDDLDRDADEEASIRCDLCGYEVGFGEWQEAALAHEQAAQVGQVGPDETKSCAKGLGG